MTLFTIENHLNVSLLSVAIAPSTFLALTVLFFAYVYVVYLHRHPLPRAENFQLIETRTQRQALAVEPTRHDHDRRDGNHLRRPSYLRRVSGRLRTHKQRDKPVAPLWLPFPSLWLPFGDKLRDGRVGVGRQIQPAGVETRRKRKTQQRLLEQ